MCYQICAIHKRGYTKWRGICTLVGLIFVEWVADLITHVAAATRDFSIATIFAGQWVILALGGLVILSFIAYFVAAKYQHRKQK